MTVGRYCCRCGRVKWGESEAAGERARSPPTPSAKEDYCCPTRLPK
jgi:hypothetical protein